MCACLSVPDVSVDTHVCQGAWLEVKGQLCEIGALLPLCGFQTLGTCFQAYAPRTFPCRASSWTLELENWIKWMALAVTQWHPPVLQGPQYYSTEADTFTGSKLWANLKEESIQKQDPTACLPSNYTAGFATPPGCAPLEPHCHVGHGLKSPCLPRFCVDKWHVAWTGTRAHTLMHCDASCVSMMALCLQRTWTSPYHYPVFLWYMTHTFTYYYVIWLV